MKKTIASCITGAILALGATSALADVSVALSPANPPISPVGANSATLSINFVGDGNGTSYSGGITFDDAQFNVLSVTSVDATCSAPTDEDGAGVVTVTFSDGAASALPSGTACTFTLDHVNTGTGNFPYSFVSLSAEDLNGNITITGAGGNVVVSAGPPTDPTGTVADPADFAAATSIGGTTTTSGAITAVGGANGGSATVSCVSDDPQITVTSVPNPATCDASNVCTPAAIQFTCSATNAAQTANVTCTSDGPNSAPVVQAPFAIACPAANVAPTIGTTTPPYDADGTSDATPEITFVATGIGQTNTQTVSVPATPGSGTSTATFACSTGSAGFTVLAPTTLTFTGSTGPSPQTISVQCTAAVAAQTGVMNCVETDSDSAGVTRVYDLACPAGLAVSAPSAVYSPAPTFGQGASVGASVPGSAPITVDIVGGTTDGTGGEESLTVACSLFNSPAFTATFTPANGTATANSIAPAGTDITANITCLAPADVAATGTLRCVETPTVNGVQGSPTNTDIALSCPAAAVNVASNPPEGPIGLIGVPGTTLNSQLLLSNTGSTSTLSCSSTGTVVLGAVPGTIPASGSATVPFSCTAGTAGASNTGTITCLTEDLGAEGQLDYTVSCTGLASNPIPAINDLGKVLMAALMIGLGLLGLGLRRQSA